MGSRTILQRLLDRFNPSVEWDVPEETVTYVEPEIGTEDVTARTTLICQRCGMHSYMKSSKCPRCDLNLF